MGIASFLIGNHFLNINKTVPLRQSVCLISFISLNNLGAFVLRAAAAASFKEDDVASVLARLTAS